MRLGKAEGGWEQHFFFNSLLSPLINIMTVGKSEHKVNGETLGGGGQLGKLIAPCPSTLICL